MDTLSILQILILYHEFPCSSSNFAYIFYRKFYPFTVSHACLFLQLLFHVVLSVSLTELIQLLLQMFSEATATRLVVAANLAYSKENGYFKNRTVTPSIYLNINRYG